MKLRDELEESELKPEALAVHPSYRVARDGDGRLELGKKDPRFWPAVGIVLDVLTATEARVADAAKVLGISTANLVDFLHL